MPAFNVIQQTFPDGTHRWKFFSFGMSVGDSLEKLATEAECCHEPGWTIERKEIENAKRAKQTVYELAKSNVDKWEWFVTLTFDPRLVHRDNYKECCAALRVLCRRLTSYGCYWLFVPERHKDGRNYHFHGIVGGDFPKVEAGLHGRKGHSVPTWNILDFPGFTTVQRVRSPARVATYITKYITKDLVHVVPKGCHRYLCSRNLLRPQVDYLSLSPLEFSCLVHYGEVPTEMGAGFDLDVALKDLRFVKKVPMYYQTRDNYMVIVED